MGYADGRKFWFGFGPIGDYYTDREHSILTAWWKLSGIGTFFHRLVDRNLEEPASVLLDHHIHCELATETFHTPMVHSVSHQLPITRMLFRDHCLPLSQGTTLFIRELLLKPPAFICPHVPKHPAEWEMLAIQQSTAVKKCQEGTAILEDIDPAFCDPETGTSMLMVAAAYGNHSLVDQLCRGRADVNTESRDGASALAYASECATGEAGQRC